ncbi:unnamed protein product [Aureobasidium vineae]|uniref:BTB domain-containing protein n=1 Tax=Aureobasidium vineae TaxID=2773715 RepID=A0A9N8PDJ0_9PEZI|nr:unnamed protein product [Aureobasidium vineae]
MDLMETYDKRIWRCDIIGKSSEMIGIKSQDDDSSFNFCTTVHKELLCFYSPYYTAAMKGGFSERHKDIFTLELSGKQTKMFVKWLYTGCLECYAWREDDNNDAYALYVFADQTDIIALRRTVMTCLATCLRRPATPGEMARLVSQFPEHSGLRRFLLDEAIADRKFQERENKVVAWDWKKRGYLPEDFPEDFYAQLVIGHVKKKRWSFGSSTSNPCHYHEHEDGEEFSLSK